MWPLPSLWFLEVNKGFLVKFSGAASRDIIGIYQYSFSNFGEEQADSYFLRMQTCLDVIQANPEIGRLDTRVTPAIRRFDFENHVIFYDVTADYILVVRILHHAMDFVKNLGTN